MSMITIGKQISYLRKKSGKNQSELADYVGVSTQAVSKWENGGVPDVELLPKIAEFFSVSIDSLFGRNFCDLNEAIVKIPKEDQFKIFFDYCWYMECAINGEDTCMSVKAVEEKANNENTQVYSGVVTDYGFTRMGLSSSLQYFLLVPDIVNTEKAFFDGTDYTGFCKDFSDKYVFDICVFLYKREDNSTFTEYYVAKETKFTEDDVNRALTILEKYKLVSKSQIEIDNEVKTVYHFKPNPAFIAFLIFAKEMIEVPGLFTCYGVYTKKPYLK